LTRVAPNTVIVILPRERELDDFAADVASFGIQPTPSQPVAEPGQRIIPAILPAWPSLPRELSIADPILGSRLRIVRGFEANSSPPVVIATINALLQPVPSRKERVVASRLVKVGEDLDLDDMAAWLVERGFERVTALEVPGEFSIHGGIIDIFPPDSSDPVRVELFGDEIESIRLFDVESQRKVASVSEIAITVLSPSDLKHDDDDPVASVSPLVTNGEHVLDAMPANAWVVFIEMEEMIREGRQYLDRLADPKGLFSVESTMQRCAARPHVNLAPLVAGSYGKQTIATPACSVPNRDRPVRPSQKINLPHRRLARHSSGFYEASRTPLRRTLPFCPPNRNPSHLLRPSHPYRRSIRFISVCGCVWVTSAGVSALSARRSLS
jgi:transcription-repair coupling factor (superfamily II helicase)